MIDGVVDNNDNQFSLGFLVFVFVILFVLVFVFVFVFWFVFGFAVVVKVWQDELDR